MYSIIFLNNKVITNFLKIYLKKSFIRRSIYNLRAIDRVKA